MIETPLEIFAVGFLAGALVASIVLAVATARTFGPIDAEVRRLRRALEESHDA